MSEAKFTRWYATQAAGGFAAIREQGTDRLIFHVANPPGACGDPETSDEEKERNLKLAAQAPELRAAVEGLKAMVLSKEAQLETARKERLASDREHLKARDSLTRERDEWKARAAELERMLNDEFAIKGELLDKYNKADDTRRAQCRVCVGTGWIDENTGISMPGPVYGNKDGVRCTECADTEREKG